MNEEDLMEWIDTIGGCCLIMVFYWMLLQL